MHFQTRAGDEAMKATFSCELREQTITVLTDAYYEEQSLQEEIYLEEREEDVRMILEFGDTSPSPIPDSLNQKRARAAEEPITGDSDDPPVAEDVVEQMLIVP